MSTPFVLRDTPKPAPAPDNEIEATVDGFESVPATPETPAAPKAEPLPVEAPKVEPKPAPLPRVERKVEPLPELGGWPADAMKNREAWLHEAARRLAREPGEDLRGLLFSVGFGKGGTRGVKDWSVIQNAKADGWQVFIRPGVDTKADASGCVGLALASLGARLHKPGAVNLATWPEYPQPDVEHEHKTQATRLIKCWCKACGYTVRTTQRWITTGAPLCPCSQPPIAMEVSK